MFLIIISSLFKILLILGIAAKFLDNTFFIFILNPLSAALITYLIKRKTKKPMLALSYFFLDTFVPVLGFLSVLIFYILGPIYKKIYQGSKIDVYDIPLGEKSYNEYTAQKRILIKDLTDEDVEDELYENFQIQPYLDVFNQDDLDLKLNAIEKLSRTLTKESVQILKKALDDISYEVRYFANSALEKIEKKMFSKVDIASENIKRFPEDYHNYNIRGQLYLDTYSLGILDSSLEDFFLERSLYDFIFSLQLNPSQSALYLRITQINLKQKDFAKVIEIADRALNLKDELNERDQAKIKFYRAEANFNLKKYSKIKDDCLFVTKAGLDYRKVKESSQWWASDET